MTTPTRPGWYWFLPDHESEIEHLKVSVDPCGSGKLYVAFGPRLERGWHVSHFHGDWEPIEPPPRMVAEVDRRKEGR